MFIFTMSALARPYLASNSSGKIESSNVFEQSSPMLNRNGLDTLPALRSHITGGELVWQPIPTNAKRRQPGRLGLPQRQRVGAIGVAAPGGGEHLVAGCGPAPAWPSRRHRARRLTPRRPRCSRGPTTNTASPTRTRRLGPAHAGRHRRPGSTTTAARSPPSHRAHGPGRTNADPPPAPTPGTGDTPAYTSCTPSPHGCSRRGPARPPNGTARTCPPHAHNRSHHADTSPHTPHTPYTTPS